MREWWREHVEAPLDRLHVNWDRLFLYTWVTLTVLTVLSGGTYVW